MSFKVINFGTHQKPVCDFLRVDNTKLSKLAGCRNMADYWSIFLSTVVPLFSRTH